MSIARWMVPIERAAMLTERRLTGEDPEDVLPSREALYAIIRAKIGEGLTARYELPQELPDRMRALLIQLDEQENKNEKS